MDMSQERSAAEIYGRDFPAGAVVFEEGDPASRMYVIISGSVRIEKRVGDRNLTLAVLKMGEAFGEMALLEAAPRSATAVVEQASRLLEIDEAAFEDLVRKNGEVAIRLLRRLSARLREANRQIRSFLSADAMSRAVEVLRALAGPPGEDGFRAVPKEMGPERLAERISAHARGAGALGSAPPGPARAGGGGPRGAGAGRGGGRLSALCGAARPFPGPGRSRGGRGRRSARRHGLRPRGGAPAGPAAARGRRARRFRAARIWPTSWN